MTILTSRGFKNELSELSVPRCLLVSVPGRLFLLS